MKVDNVTFVEVAVKGMTKEEFINAHIKVVWQELKEADRKKKLSEVLIREVGLVDIDGLGCDYSPARYIFTVWQILMNYIELFIPLHPGLKRNVLGVWKNIRMCSLIVFRSNYIPVWTVLNIY